MPESPLTRLFADRKIRFRGDAMDPLLCAKDVAASIQDNNWYRMLKSFTNPRHFKVVVLPGNRCSVRAKFFTERGVYKYLTQSKLPGAAEFQEFVYDLLSAERLRVVNEQQLQAKISLDAQLLRNEVLQIENNSLKAESASISTENIELKAVNEGLETLASSLRTENGELKAESAAIQAKNADLESKTSELKGSVQFYKQSLRQSDWLLTKAAPEAEEAFKRPGAYWTDLAKYYCKRANFEVERNFVPTDPAELDPQLKRICWDCFADPSMHYDGYAIFLKKAQELHELHPKRSNKPEKIYTIADVDPALYAANLKLIQADSAKRRALLISRGAKLPPPPPDDDDYGGRWA